MNLLIIGLGSMGKRRIRLIQSIRPQDTLIGVDQSTSRIRETEDKYGIQCCASIEEALVCTPADCAFVCTSPASHGKIIRQCLEAGLHIFTEINLIADQYKENIALAQRQNKMLFLSSTPVYRDEMRTINSIVKEQDKPVNYIYHVGQYLPDWHPWEKYTDFFVQNPRTNGCREILAIEFPWMLQTFGQVSQIHVLKNRLTDLKLNYTDSYLVQLLHENGTQGIFAVDVACRQAVRKLEIYNEELYIEWNGKPETLLRKDLASGEMKQICDTSYHREAGYSEFVNEYAYVNELKCFFMELEKFQGSYSNDIYGFSQDMQTLQLIDQIEGITKC